MINVGAGYNNSARQGGWGCLARDTTGDVLFAAAGQLTDVSDTLHAETMALIHAIHLAENFGMGCDCQTVKIAMESSQWDRAPIGVLF